MGSLEPVEPGAPEHGTVVMFYISDGGGLFAWSTRMPVIPAVGDTVYIPLADDPCEDPHSFRVEEREFVFEDEVTLEGVHLGLRIVREQRGLRPPHDPACPFSEEAEREHHRRWQAIVSEVQKAHRERVVHVDG